MFHQEKIGVSVRRRGGVSVSDRRSGEPNARLGWREEAWKGCGHDAGGNERDEGCSTVVQSVAHHGHADKEAEEKSERETSMASRKSDVHPAIRIRFDGGISVGRVEAQAV